MAGGSSKNHQILHDNIQSISKDAIKRLARTAGVKYISGLVYEEVRLFIMAELETILKDTIIITEHKREKRVKTEAVLYALDRNGRKYYSTGQEEKMKRCSQTSSGGGKTDKKVEEKPKKRKYKKGTVALREIRKYQNKSDCYQLNRAGFIRLVREVGQNMNTDLQYSANALGVLQHHIETFIVKLLEMSNLAAIHRGCVTIHPKDLELTRRINDKWR